MCWSRPELTATSDLFFEAPVAKALGCGDGKIATSGIPIPAALACRATVSTSQRSSALRGFSITSAPVERFASHFDMASEMNEPPNPNSAHHTSSA